LEKILKMDCDEAIEYVVNNVKNYDHLELSYNRIYTPGEVISIETECLKGRKQCSVMIQLTGDTLRNTIEIDLEEVKDDLIEIKHLPRDENDETLIVIEKCDI